jgi:hypothetical protein
MPTQHCMHCAHNMPVPRCMHGVYCLHPSHCMHRIYPRIPPYYVCSPRRLTSRYIHCTYPPYAQPPIYALPLLRPLEQPSTTPPPLTMHCAYCTPYTALRLPPICTVSTVTPLCLLGSHLPLCPPPDICHVPTECPLLSPDICPVSTYPPPIICTMPTVCLLSAPQCMCCAHYMLAPHYMHRACPLRSYLIVSMCLQLIRLA